MVAKKTNEVFINEVKDLVGDEYTFMEPYVTSSDKLKIIHNACGYEYTISPNSFLRGSRCPMCSGNNAKRKTTDSFSKEVYELVGDEYTVLGEYVARNVPILMRHNLCGREYKVEPGNFLYRSRCIECYYESLRLSKYEVEERITLYLGDEYHLEGDYTSSQKKTLLHHDRCNNNFYVRIDDISQKRSGCPYCSSSRGEDYIRSILKRFEYDFEEQVKFDGLVDVFSLSYDFLIPSKKVLIEYQGSQHYYPKTWGGMSKEDAIKRLDTQRKHDNMKRKYASDNGYKLIEIPYKFDTLDKVQEQLLAVI